MNHDEIRERLEAYALGALDEPELTEVRDHLTSCERCRDELDAYERVAAALPRALAAASPVAPSDVAAQRIRRAIRRRAVRSRVATIAAAVAGVLLVAAAAWIWRSERTLADERERVDRLVEEQFIVFEVAAAPDRRETSLRAVAEDADWYGKVYTHPQMSFVVVMANRLPEVAAGDEYHVWLTLDDGNTVLAGLLEPNADGFDPLIYTAEVDGPVIADAVVTAEQAGATEPTGPAVLAAAQA